MERGPERATQAAQIFACGDSFVSGDGRVWWSHRAIEPWPSRLRLPGFDGVRVVNVGARRAKTSNLGWLDAPGQLVGEVPPGHGNLQLAHPAVGRTTDLVLVCVGGNDAGFAYLLWKASRLSGPWDGAEAEIARRVENTREGIGNVFRSLRLLAPNAAVVAIGYPHAVPTLARSQRCPWLSVWWSHRGQDLINLAADMTNEVTAQLADREGVHFLDLRGVFDGHEACGRDGEWVRGPVAGWLPGMRGPSLHPTAEGHRQIALAVERFLAARVGEHRALTPHGLPANPAPR
jgi:lysophospholipase L1-like esterase